MRCGLWLCTGSCVLLFIALAEVQCCSVKCALFDWSVIEHVKLNHQLQNCVFPQIDSVYQLTALCDGVNHLSVHTKPIHPEHAQVLRFHCPYVFFIVNLHVITFCTFYIHNFKLMYNNCSLSNIWIESFISFSAVYTRLTICIDKCGRVVCAQGQWKKFAYLFTAVCTWFRSCCLCGLSRQCVSICRCIMWTWIQCYIFKFLL